MVVLQGQRIILSAVNAPSVPIQTQQVMYHTIQNNPCSLLDISQQHISWINCANVSACESISRQQKMGIPDLIKSTNLFATAQSHYSLWRDTATAAAETGWGITNPLDPHRRTQRACALSHPHSYARSYRNCSNYRVWFANLPKTAWVLSICSCGRRHGDYSLCTMFCRILLEFKGCVNETKVIKFFVLSTVKSSLS